MGSGKMSNQDTSAFSAIKSGDIQGVLGYLMNTPGASVNREKFLANIYDVSEDDIRNNNYTVSYAKRKRLAKHRIKVNVRNSSGLSFVGGIPGGFAMAGTIPADILQNMVFSIRLVQELVYIYDYQDVLDADEHIESDRMMMFLGIMFGVQGAASIVRVMSANAAKYTSKKIMNTALTKTVWYPLLKKVTAVVASKTITKKGLASVASKSIPVIGGVTSGGITYVSMNHESNRLNDELLHGFGHDYDEDEYRRDIKIIEAEYEDVTDKDL